MTQVNWSKNLPREKNNARIGMVAGILVLLGSLCVLPRFAYARHISFTKGKWSSQSILRTRQQIKELPPTEENLQKLADAVYKRLSDDAEWIDSSMASDVYLIVGLAGLGAYVFQISLKRKRCIDALQQIETPAAPPIPPPTTRPTT